MLTAPSTRLCSCHSGPREMLALTFPYQGSGAGDRLKNVLCLGFAFLERFGRPRAQVASGSQTRGREVAPGRPSLPLLPPGHTSCAPPCLALSGLTGPLPSAGGRLWRQGQEEVHTWPLPGRAFRWNEVPSMGHHHKTPQLGAFHSLQRPSTSRVSSPITN